jgi:hypothetical protein
MTRRMSPVATVFSLLGFLLLGSSGAVSTLGLADIFSDHMVLQRHTQIRVWGHAVVGAQVTAALLWRDRVDAADSGSRWRWSLTTRTSPAAGRRPPSA